MANLQFEIYNLQSIQFSSDQFFLRTAENAEIYLDIFSACPRLGGEENPFAPGKDLHVGSTNYTKISFVTPEFVHSIRQIRGSIFPHVGGVGADARLCTIAFANWGDYREEIKKI
jgi:hypothetical protein